LPIHLTEYHAGSVAVFNPSFFLMRARRATSDGQRG